MVSRGLLLCLFISILTLIADGAWPDWASLNPIAEVAKKVPKIGNNVAKTVKEGVDKIGNTTGLGVEMLHGLTPLTAPAEGVIVFVGQKITGNDTAWECGPDYPPVLDKPSHIGTELMASLVRDCRLRREQINKCCIAHDKCCNTEPRKKPCDEPFCTCLKKVGNDSGDVLCLGVVMSYCVTMNLAGDKDAPHLKWLKEQAMKSTSAAPTENATSGA